MKAHTGFGARDRWGLRQNRLWILAAALGAATIYSGVSIIHDTSGRHIAARLVRRATADRITQYASARLTTLGVEALANAPTANALLRRQRSAVHGDTFPARTFFRVDLVTNALAIAGDSSTVPATLIEIAKSDAARQTPRPAVHLTTSRDLAIITYVQVDSTNQPRVVNGLVAPAREIGQTLFADADRATTTVDMGERMVTLDSLSLLVQGGDSTVLFGAVEQSGRFYGVNQPRGALDGIDVAVALAPSQLNPALLLLVPRPQLWHNGMLMLGTILVLIFAVGSARREMLLARSRSDFVAGVSHELRMPLAQILLASETLTTHPSTPERERLGLANTIVREARRLIALVENLLLFSRTGAVELHVRPETVSVEELLATVVESVELAAEDARQTIDVKAPPSLGVTGDRQLLRQALVNLVDNALKYGKVGQRIEVAASGTTDGRVRLSVDDEGPGIPAADRKRVFEPYQRLGRDQTSERTGAGLGLSVVRQIVEACGGRVWIEDSTRGGARVVIELAAAVTPAPTPKVGAPA
jgi:signal transduction histidine kinase